MVPRQHVTPLWTWVLVLVCCVVAIQVVEPLFVLLVFAIWSAGAHVAELLHCEYRQRR